MIRVTTASELVPGELLMLMHPDILDKVLSDVMAGARNHWIKRAGEKLHSTLRDYLDGLHEVEMEPGRASLALVGELPNMIEWGTGPYSMHPGLLGPGVPLVPVGQRGKHASKGGGFYRAIPLRHQTPRSSGKGGGQPMGSQYFKDIPSAGLSGNMQSALGKAVHKAAKKLAPTTGMPGGGTKWGGRLPAGVGGAQKLKAHHTTDIYAGMVRSQKQYGKAVQNTYTTFRTISSAHPEKWIHPGFHAASIVDDVQAYVEKTLPAAILAIFPESM